MSQGSDEVRNLIKSLRDDQLAGEVRIQSPQGHLPDDMSLLYGQLLALLMMTGCQVKYTIRALAGLAHPSQCTLHCVLRHTIWVITVETADGNGHCNPSVRRTMHNSLRSPIESMHCG
ncbi:hypothetical protein TNCV_4494391 [Trichonephila clavipes]|nr:hypothetical protein TNCV_4494391 [Trichonephila clavipes]